MNYINYNMIVADFKSFSMDYRPFSVDCVLLLSMRNVQIVDTLGFSVLSIPKIRVNFLFISDLSVESNNCISFSCNYVNIIRLSMFSLFSILFCNLFIHSGDI